MSLRSVKSIRGGKEEGMRQCQKKINIKPQKGFSGMFFIDG